MLRNEVKPLQAEIPPTSKAHQDYNPGFPVYSVTVKNMHNRAIIASVSYDHSSGELLVIFMEEGS